MCLTCSRWSLPGLSVNTGHFSSHHPFLPLHPPPALRCGPAGERLPQPSLGCVHTSWAARVSLFAGGFSFCWSVSPSRFSRKEKDQLARICNSPSKPLSLRALQHRGGIFKHLTLLLPGSLWSLSASPSCLHLCSLFWLFTEES